MAWRPVLRSIAAVAGGYVAAGLLVVLTDQVYAAAVPGFQSRAQPPLYYFCISLLTGFLYAAVGGWVTVRIANREPQKHAVALIILGVLAGIASLIAFWTTEPHWYGLGLLIEYPPAVWLGARLGMKSEAGRDRSLAAAR